MAAPVVLASLSQTLMGLIDTVMVGRLGTEAIAAVGVATLLFSAGAIALKSLDVSVQTFTARRDGEGRPRTVGAVLGTALTVVLALGGWFGRFAYLRIALRPTPRPEYWEAQLAALDPPGIPRSSGWVPATTRCVASGCCRFWCTSRSGRVSTDLDTRAWAWSPGSA